MADQRTTHKELFERFKDSTLLSQSEQYAEWTVPTVFPRQIVDGKRIVIERDFQMDGAMLLNNLASKMMQTLFPVGASFFRIMGSPQMQQLAEQAGYSAEQTESAYATIQEGAHLRSLANGGYAQLSHMTKLGLITGNALLVRANKRWRVYSVRDYVTFRNGEGKCLFIVLREHITRSEVPAGILPDAGEPWDTVELYTLVQWKSNKWEVTQEIEGKLLNEKPNTYPEMLCPYIPAVWNLVTGEHYGRGLVEDYAGGFARLSNLTEALTLYEAEACKIVNCVDPSGGGDIDAFNDAANGEYVAAKKDSVFAHESGSHQKIASISADIQGVATKLGQAMMYTGNVRDSERTTATEIQNSIREADQSFGGNYSTFAQSVLVPMAHILAYEEYPQILGPMAQKLVTLDVTVGVASVHRSAQVSRLMQATLDASQIVPAMAQLTQRTNPDALVDEILAAYGIQYDQWMLTADELAEKQQAEQEAAQMNAVAPQAADAATSQVMAEQVGAL